MPLVSIQIQTTNYSGPPYTSCNRHPDYSLSLCHYTALNKQIVDICGCVPDYVPDIRNIVKNQTIKGCNFYEHATCVSYLTAEFDLAKTDCLPACLESVYHQAKIQVFLKGSDQYNLFALLVYQSFSK